MLYIGLVGIFGLCATIIYLFNFWLSKKEIETKMSGTLLDWAKKASKVPDKKRSNWLMVVYIVLAIAGLYLGISYLKTPAAGILMGVLLAGIPGQIISNRKTAHDNKIMEQLGMATRIFTSEYRDTPHPVRALEITAQKVPNPLGKVLNSAVLDFSSGKSVDETLLKLNRKLNTPYGRLFVQLLRQSFDDSAVTNLFVKLSSRLSSRQDLVQENNKQIAANRIVIVLLNLAIVPVFLAVNKFLPESYIFFTQETSGKLIVSFTLSSAVGSLLMDRWLNGGGEYD